MKNKVAYFVTLLIGSLLFYQGSNVLYVPGYIKFLICCYFFCMAYIKYSGSCMKQMFSVSNLESFLSNNGFGYIIYIYLPYVVIFMYTLVLLLCGRLIDNQMQAAITMFGSISAGILLIPSTKYLFKEDGVYFWIYASCVCYINVIIKSIFDFGIQSIIYFKEYNEKCMSYLESHELIFVFGIFWIYLLFTSKKDLKNKLLFFVISVFILLGYKRIALGALFCVLLFWGICKRKWFRNLWIYDCINKLLFVITGIYAWLSAFGVSVFKSVSNILRIDFMGRIQIMEYFQDCFDWESILFGQGFMFSDKFLTLSSKVDHYAAIHNDVLRVFIDIGIIGFVVFFIYLILYLPKKLSVKNCKIMFFVEAVLMYLLVHYTTDNLMIYPRFFAMLGLVLVYYSYREAGEGFEKMFSFNILGLTKNKRKIRK